jgi:hypothetical protein
MRLKSRSSVFPIFTVLFLLAGIADAQFEQYTPPGGPQQRPESRESRLKREVQAAHYHLGPVRLAPDIGLKDVAYVRNLFAQESGGESDLTATATAGLHGYLYTGRKIVWVGHVQPDYVWWRHRSEERRLNLSYGIEGLAFFNHLFVGVAASRSEQQRILTPEVLQPSSSKTDQAQVTAELRFSGAFSAFVTAGQTRESGLVDNTEADPRLRALALLDRTEKVARAGVRWRPIEGWTLGVGAERSQVDFDRSAADSSNAGTAPILELLVDRNRFFFLSDLAARSLEARQGSHFVAFDGVTGRVAAAVKLGPDLELWGYGNRNLVYSLSQFSPYLDDRRLGLAVAVALNRRILSRFYVETGEDRYISFSAADARRRDDISAVGGSVRFLITETVAMIAQVVHTRYDSNIAGADRSYTSGGVSLTLGRLP